MMISPGTAKTKPIIENIHNREHWFGRRVPQTETNWACPELNPYVATSGANSYGADPGDEAKLLGLEDTPCCTLRTFYSVHLILVVDVTEESVWKLRFVHGMGTLEEAIAAEQFSELMLRTPEAKPGVPVPLRAPKLRCAIDKAWLQAWNASDVDATISFYIGVLEYESVSGVG